LGPQSLGVSCDSGLLASNGIAPENTLPSWQTVITAMFMHGSILHIGGNMLFLWIFGNNIEDSMGPAKFIIFYIFGGLAALALQIAVSPNSTAPTIGASGAIAAVLGGYILLYPRARVLTLVFIILFFTVIELPAIVMLGVWFAQQAIFGAANLTNPAGGGGGVAYFAHLGGFLFGLAVVRLLASKRKEIPAARFPVY
jgi:membrane associated rhomboid family serine protease